jgi:hypothetical protein
MNLAQMIAVLAHILAISVYEVLGLLGLIMLKRSGFLDVLMEMRGFPRYA